MNSRAPVTKIHGAESGRSGSFHGRFLFLIGAKEEHTGEPPELHLHSLGATAPTNRELNGCIVIDNVHCAIRCSVGQ
jgi:hypothetical protein